MPQRKPTQGCGRTGQGRGGRVRRQGGRRDEPGWRETRRESPGACRGPPPERAPPRSHPRIQTPPYRSLPLLSFSEVLNFSLIKSSIYLSSSLSCSLRLGYSTTLHATLFLFSSLLSSCSLIHLSHLPALWRAPAPADSPNLHHQHVAVSGPEPATQPVCRRLEQRRVVERPLPIVPGHLLPRPAPRAADAGLGLCTGPGQLPRCLLREHLATQV